MELPRARTKRTRTEPPSSAVFQFIHLPRDKQCQILAQITDGAQILALSEADEKGEIADLIQNCVETIKVESNPQILDVLNFIPRLNGLKELEIKTSILYYALPRLVNTTYAGHLFESKLFEIVKLPQLRKISIDHGKFSIENLLTEHCRGLVRSVNEKGIIEMTQLNRTLDQVEFRFSGFSIKNGVIRQKTHGKLEIMAIELMENVRGLTLTEEATLIQFLEEMWRSRRAFFSGIEKLILELDEDKEFDEIQQNWPNNRFLRLIVMFAATSPLRVIEFITVSEDSTKLLLFWIEKRIPIPATLRKINFPLSLDDWEDIELIFEGFNKVEFFMLYVHIVDDLDLLLKNLPDLLRRHPQIKKIKILLNLDYENLPADFTEPTEVFDAHPEEVKRQFPIEIQPKLKVIWWR